MHVTSYSAPLLIAAVAAVGILHTMVPDHWAPIAVLARQHGWSRTDTARAAAIAGLGHTVSTLLIAVLVWVAGAALAARFGRELTLASSAALIAFGLWIAVSGLRDLKREGHEHSHFGHSHVHRHAGGPEHRHWHVHHEHDWHAVDGNLALAPEHEHGHETSRRTALLLILGSSPMVEGIPAFFAAGRYGIAQLIGMSVVFAASTTATYVVLCLLSAAGMERLNLGRFERYGEVLSGGLVAALGVAFLVI